MNKKQRKGKITEAAITKYRVAIRVILVVTNDMEHDAVLTEIDDLMDRELDRNSPDSVRL